MQITEPMTLATDYLLGIAALSFAVRLYRPGTAASRLAVRTWATAFLMTAVAAFVGGSYHGFVEMMSAEFGRALWQTTLVATGIGSAALLAAAVLAGTAGTLRRVLLITVLLKLAAYLWWISSRSDFIFVIYDYSSALVGVLALAWFARRSGLTAAAPWISAGVAVSVVAAMVQSMRLAPHPQFNHNDLFHVIQIAALYCLYRGGLLMRDVTSAPLK